MPLPLPVPDIVSLDLLKSVAELGSIRQAAEAHNVSQPAASMRVKSLEKSLGIRLVSRANGRAQLTAAGVAVVQWSEQILEGAGDLIAGVKALRSKERSSLKVAASMTVAEYLVPIWLNRLRRISSEIAVSLQMGNSEQVAAIIRGKKADIGFVEGRTVPTEFYNRKIYDDALVVVVSPGHPWSHRKKIVAPKELSSMPMVLREAGSGTREVFEKALEPLDLAPMALVELASNTAIKAMVGSGVGPGVLSRLVAKPELDSGRLVEVRTRGVSLDRSITAIWSRSKPMSASAKRLLKIITEMAPPE